MSARRAGELAAFDAPLSGLDHVRAVLVAALVAPDLPGGVDIDPIELDAMASALCSSYAHGCSPRSFATRSVIVARSRGLSAGLKAGSLG
jgi:hypothetical protein